MKIKTLLFLFITLFISGLRAQEQLQIGQIAPDFNLPYATKDSIDWNGISLKKFINTSNVVLAFYPADWSSGCTKELCTIRDNFEKLGELKAEILAISGDYVFSHKEWAKELNLPFKLLSDHNHFVAKKYMSYNEKSGFNKRTIFIVGKNGKIAYINPNYNVNDQKDFVDLQKALEKLK